MSSDRGDLERRIEDSPYFEERVAGALQHRHRWRWRALWIWMIAFTLAVIFLYESIQVSRIQSCKENYSAFNKVFKPFLPPKGAKVDKKQQDNIDKFHATIHDLRTQCRKQVRVVWDWSKK